MLRAWDGAESGASRRDIAGVLFRTDFSGLSAAEWKSASERRHCPHPRRGAGHDRRRVSHAVVGQAAPAALNRLPPQLQAC
ncbi:DUF2285 domain-containing protein [Paracoccus mutanolyticus]|uniref:DUF2285 domain-containing protein n=1 Tax=Paracoccus mutanolyticus TaxID=1499308 RepID=UPI0021D53425|nr:DUF2285 domain-containing protein [Paracoccus mutanolyticus]